MGTFVLVQGAWHGGWCWKKVVPLLRTAGHEVFMPTLTGLGERVHLLRPEVGLETHIADVLGVLRYEDLQEVVLVGHSYGGMVITGVAAQAAERLAQLVYLDAFVPRDGQCLLDLLPPDLAAAVREQAKVVGDGWRVPPLPLEGFGAMAEADLRWAGAKVGDQPLLAFEQPVRSPATAGAGLARTYIACTGWQGPFGPFAEQARTDTTWRYRELDTGHEAMITAPAELATLLLEAMAVPAVAPAD